MNNNMSPAKRKYDIFILLYLVFSFLATIPLFFCEKLEGFYLIYFILYVSLVVIFLTILCIYFPIVRKLDIKYFKNKYSKKNFDNLIIYNFKEEDYIFYANNIDFKFTKNGLKDLLNNKEYSYNSLNIYATYECGFAGEIYKVFINFEKENLFFSFKLNNILYSLVKHYKIQVNNLEKVLNECENNLKNFYKDNSLRNLIKKSKNNKKA
ncbi:MAG: hypothetical protein E7359_03535 [Clostridiales bacterium]|nr:hypothetical protein [Clostridiales bacterium]